jgi:hypothetical protein
MAATKTPHSATQRHDAISCTTTRPRHLWNVAGESWSDKSYPLAVLWLWRVLQTECARHRSSPGRGESYRGKAESVSFEWDKNRTSAGRLTLNDIDDIELFTHFFKAIRSNNAYARTLQLRRHQGLAANTGCRDRKLSILHVHQLPSSKRVCIGPPRTAFSLVILTICCQGSGYLRDDGRPRPSRDRWRAQGVPRYSSRFRQAFATLLLWVLWEVRMFRSVREALLT